jgi:hypothetical protein
MTNQEKVSTIQPETPEDGIVTTNGDLVEDPTARDRAIVRMAYLLLEDEELHNAALNYCLESGQQQLTLEQYVHLKFNRLLNQFPDVHSDYLSDLAEEELQRQEQRKQDVLEARKRLATRRKRRRNVKR